MKPLILSISLIFAFALPAAAKDWALGGYDAVGYSFGRAVPGRSDIATMWKGKSWHFVSEENRTRFEADPRQFAPAFEGFCPVSLADGRKERGDPRFFAVIDRQLYLLRSDVELRRIRRAPDEILDEARKTWSMVK
ncbi:YHS domain-containing (seleno)protein [Paracoccus methylarcula]|uniref:YHS domain-containing protein n=1 Tax=Paracoccus methylarcula TaxID=72022 RepID=A0A422QX07_9RHOB|nr:YHS domain-containing (seleno)protein [Paracoccus methylarcula]RNF34498.1 hypothetical protein A7A09_011510 [Paracoccus methylarcula]